MRHPFKKHVLTPHVPQECQVHTCKNEATAFCELTWIFVCNRHVEEFCIPQEHKLKGIGEGLEACIAEAVGAAAANRTEAERQDRMAAKYRDRLQRLNDIPKVPTC